MAAKVGSLREKLLSVRGCSELGLIDIEALDGRKRSPWSYRAISDRIVGFLRTIQDVSFQACEMGRSDPRKIVFSAKMGLALMLMSLLIYLKEPLKDLSRYSVWAILTVVVVFEFSIGMF